MDITHVTARVVGVGRDGEPYEADFLVDTGALHCLVPASDLRRAGVEPEGSRVYELATGERDRAAVWFCASVVSRR